MLQKEKHEYIKKILKDSEHGYQLTDAETQTLAEWYMSAPSNVIRKKRPIKMSVQKGRYGTSCLRFDFEDGTANIVSRLVIVGKKSR